MNEKEQAQWLFDNLFDITNDVETAKKAARFVAEEVIQEIFDTGGSAERSQYWMHTQQMIANDEIIKPSQHE